LALDRAISTMQVIEEFIATGFERQRRAFIPAQGNALGLRDYFIKPCGTTVVSPLGLGVF